MAFSTEREREELKECVATPENPPGGNWRASYAWFGLWATSLVICTLPAAEYGRESACKKQILGETKMD